MDTPSTIGTRSGPLGLKWRSSVWFVTGVVTLGISTDLLVYSIVIPVLPFQLERLGYTGISGLVGWILFAYSGGLVVSTPPIAHISELYNARKVPLITGQIFLIGSQVMLMEAPRYWVMVLARIIQGISSSMIWVVGLALLCDTTPEEAVGRQLGIAMSGISLGMLIGPPIGGALYQKFGFRGPFVFGIIVTFVDLLGRLLVIERNDAMRSADSEQSMLAGAPDLHIRKDLTEATSPGIEKALTEALPAKTQASVHPRLSLLRVVMQLVRSPRALTVMFNTLVYGVVFSSQEPTLPLHLQAVWGFDSAKVGLVFLAAVIPTLLSSVLSGWWTDRKGTEWITFLFLLFSLPWWGLIIIQSSLALFIVLFALESFFTAGVVSPLIAELAAIVRKQEGVGYAHAYGAFNLSYGIGAALGPLIGGQIYDHIVRGWMVVCVLALGLLTISALLAFWNTGDEPLRFKLIRWCSRRSTTATVASAVMS